MAAGVDGVLCRITVRHRTSSTSETAPCAWRHCLCGWPSCWQLEDRSTGINNPWPLSQRWLL